METTTISPAPLPAAPAATVGPAPAPATTGCAAVPGTDRTDRTEVDVALRIRGLRRSVRDRVLLDDIDLEVRAGSLVAIAGPSGAGKSTLLTIVAGLAPASAGTVDVADADHTVGFVPQEDIIHRDLPLGTTLRYAARLRLAAADPATIERSVSSTLELLGLAGQRDVRVASLSGGQRKRASIAVELLTHPTICLLDEPTSGLDPVSAAGVLRCLRELTARGVTVVMTTHDPSQLEQADQVVFLADGGRLAHAGTPEEALVAFGVDSLLDVYDQLGRANVVTSAATDRTSLAGTRRRSPFGRAIPSERGAPPSRGRAPRSSAATALRRWAVLTRRTAALLVANRLTLAILVGSPVLVITMMALLFPSDAFADPTAATTAAPQILFWMAFAGFFFGLTFGLLQIVTERDVVRRERASGIGSTTYLAAKLGVLVPVLAVVCFALLTMLAATDRLPPLEPATFAVLLGTLVLEATAALALGMLASAAVGDAAQATLALPMLCFPQVLFAGAIVPMATMSGVAQALSTPLATRWAFEALGRSLPAGPTIGPAAAVYPEVFAGGPATGWVVLAASTAACLAVTRRLLER
jgi:ABC-type multidrug transport system ATPase subunit